MPTAELSPLEALQARCAVAATSGVNRLLEGARAALFLRRRPPRDPERIVAYAIGNVGDIVVSIPGLIALRERYPKAHIVFFTSAGARGLPGARGLLDGAPYFDDFVEYALEDLHSPGGARRLLARLRAQRPDLVVFFPSSLTPWRSLLRNLVFTRLTGARWVSGLRACAAPFFELAQAKGLGRFPQEASRLLGGLAELGVDVGAMRFELGHVAPDDAAAVRRIAEALPEFIAICPGGKQVPHRWPIERFCAIAARLPLPVVVVGSAQERALGDAVVASARHGGRNAAGELSLRATAELLSRARFLLTNDTGPMHLAAAVGTPVVAVFGSRDYAGRWYPVGPGHEICRATEVCVSCLFSRELSSHCVERITVDEVWAGCERVLTRTAAARTRALARQGVQ